MAENMEDLFGNTIKDRHLYRIKGTINRDEYELIYQARLKDNGRWVVAHAGIIEREEESELRPSFAKCLVPIDDEEALTMLKSRIKHYSKVKEFVELAKKDGLEARTEKGNMLIGHMGIDEESV